MSGFIDLHLHYVPGVDDGARSMQEALELCAGLKSLGFGKLVTTPHIRAGMFDNRRELLVHAFEALCEVAATRDDLPTLGLSAEHHCDAHALELLRNGGLVPYPGERSILLEFGYEALPVAVEQVMFKFAVKGLRPVIAHPERCAPLFRRTDPIARLLDQDVGLQLDVMALTGKYGRSPRNAAERMLEEGVYTIAASDAHRPDDVPEVGKGLERLFKLIGDDEATLLLKTNPERLLAGRSTE